MSRVRVLRHGLLIMCLLLASATPARAGLWNGYCRLHVTITFTGSTKLRSAALDENATPAYSMSVSGVDADPSTDGTQRCVVPLALTVDPPSRYRSTSPSASPATTDDDVWTCEFVHSWGTWNQTWTPSPPAGTTGDYELVGAWGAWFLVIHEGTVFASTIALTFGSPLAAVDDLPLCLDTTGVPSLSLTGAQIFQDP